MEWERNVYDCQRQKEIGYWYLGPRDIPYQALSWLTVANDEFLSSWTVHIGQDHNSLGLATLRRHMAHLRLCPLAQAGNWMAETRQWHKMHGPPGTVACCLPHIHLRFWTWGKHRAHSQSWSVPLPSTWVPDCLRPGKCIKHRAHLGQCPQLATRRLSRVDTESTCHICQWQAQCGSSTSSTATYPSSICFQCPTSHHKTLSK